MKKDLAYFDEDEMIEICKKYGIDVVENDGVVLCGGVPITDQLTEEDIFGTRGVFRALIDEEPTVDAMEVVRCMSCKHRTDSTICPMCFRDCSAYGGSWVIDQTEDNGYCHKGERREDEV